MKQLKKLDRCCIYEVYIYKHPVYTVYEVDGRFVSIENIIICATDHMSNTTVTLTKLMYSVKCYEVIICKCGCCFTGCCRTTR